MPFFIKESSIGYRKLSWNDFNGKPGVNWAAMTYYSFETTTVQDGNVVTEQHAKVFFESNKSWVRNRNERVLRHEQLHFDIAEIYARKLTATMNPDSLWKECYKIQNLYDNETNHSIDSVAQGRWERKINQQIQGNPLIVKK